MDETATCYLNKTTDPKASFDASESELRKVGQKMKQDDVSTPESILTVEDMETTCTNSD